MPIDPKQLEYLNTLYKKYEEYYKKPYIESKIISGLTFGQVEPEARAARSNLEKILGVASEFAAMTPGFGLAGKLAGYGTKFAGLTGMAAKIGTEAGIGAIIGAVEPAENERERVAHILENAAIFGAFGVAMQGLSKLVKKIRGVKDIKTPLTEEEIGEIVQQSSEANVINLVVKNAPEDIRNRFAAWAEQYRIKPEQYTEKFVDYGTMMERFGGRAPEPKRRLLGPAERVEMPGGQMKVSLKKLDLREGDLVINRATKQEHVVKSVTDKFIGVSEPGTKGTKQIPVMEFRKEWVFAGPGIAEEIGKPVTKEITERLAEKPLGSIEEAERFKEWKKGRGEIPEAKRPAIVGAARGEKETFFYEDLKKGDRFKIDGEDFEVIEKDAKKALIKDGVVYELEPGFSPIDVDVNSLKRLQQKIGKAEISAGAVTLNDAEKTMIEAEITALEQGKLVKGGLRKDAEGKVIGRFASENTNPAWFTEGGYSQYGKKNLINMLRKATAGKKLTPKQRAMFEDILEDIRLKHKPPGGGGRLYGVAPVGIAAGIEQDEKGNWRLDPTKALIGMAGTATLAMAAMRMPGFYSKLEKLIAEKMPKKAGAQDVKNIILKGGIKEEEMQVSGVIDWLGKQGKSVEKDEVVKYLEENQVGIKEKIKGGEINWGNIENELKVNNNIELGNGYTIFKSKGNYYYVRRNGINQLTTKNIEAIKNHFERVGTKFQTKYGAYQLPGGENYRELLVTLPEKEVKLERVSSEGWKVKTIKKNEITGQRKIEIYDKNGNWLSTREGFRGTDDEAIQYFKNSMQEGKNKEAIKRFNYESPHWPGEGPVLGHVRFNERTDAEGKKVLFIEEIQSDWHQAGRKKGYKADENAILKQLKDEFEISKEAGNDFGFLTKDNKVIHLNANFDTAGKIPDKAQELISKYWQIVNTTIPDAPFKKSWPELLFRRMVRWASEHGFDRIGWTTGRQQAERYDLRRQVESVMYKKNGDLAIVEKGKNNYQIIANTTEEKIEDYIGKEPAKKILEAKPNDYGDRFIQGEDLAVGGEGMNKFYDEMLPNVANKVGKKWGAKVGETSLKTGKDTEAWQVYDYKGKFYNVYSDKPGAERVIKYQKNAEKWKIKRVFTEGPKESVHAVDITPEMKKDVMGMGQPLFGVTGGLAGFSQDDEGRIRFDPTRALIGLGGGILLGKAIGIDRAKQLIDKIARLKGDGAKFIQRTFNVRMSKLGELDEAEAKGLETIVDSMLRRQKGIGSELKKGAEEAARVETERIAGANKPIVESMEAGREEVAKAAKEKVGSETFQKLNKLIEEKGAGATRRAMEELNIAGKSVFDLTQKEGEKLEKILDQMPKIQAAKEAGKETIHELSVQSGAIGKVKKILDKGRRFLDALPETNFDKANLERYGAAAWNKGRHAEFARDVNRAISDDIFKGKKAISKVAKQQLGDFKAAVTLNMEREMYDPLKWDELFQQAMERQQDPVTKEFLGRVKRIIDENGAELQKYSKVFKEDFKEQAKVLIDEGLKEEFIDNYITHLWDMSGETIASSKVALKTQFQFAKERNIPSYIEGIAMGMKPVGLDVVGINEIYKKNLETVLANRRFVNEMRGVSIKVPNGDEFRAVIDRKTFDAMTGLEQRQYTTVNHRAFNQVYVHNSVAKDIKNIFETSKWREVWYGNKFVKLNQLLKRAKLAFSGFHFVALGYNNMFYHGDKWWKLGNPLPFNLFGWQPGWKKGLQEYYKANPITEFLVKNGLTLDEGAMADYYYKIKNNMSAWPTTKNVWGITKEHIEDFTALWDKALWTDYYVGSKAMAGMTAYARNLKFLEKKYPKLYEEWARTGFAKNFKTDYEKLAAQIASRDINDLYGGLNYELFKISQTSQDTLRAFMLAPDWQISNWRSFLNGLRGLATAGRSPTTVDAMRRLAQVAVMLGGMGAVINKVTTNRMPWDNPEGYKGMTAIGHIDGKPYYIDLYRHFGEFLKVWKYGAEGKPGTYLYDSPLRYFINKSSSIQRLMINVVTGEDWRGRPLADIEALKSGKLWQSPYKPYWERGSVLPGLMIEIGEALIPIPGLQMQKSVIGDQPWIVGGSSLFGIHIKEYNGDWAKWKFRGRKGISGIKGIGGVK